MAVIVPPPFCKARGQMMNARIIAIANQKGGTGKTATAASLGVALANEGKRVLLVDADPQGDLTKSLGLGEPDTIEITLANQLEDIINDSPSSPFEGIVHHEENVDLMPANIRLANVDTALVLAMNRERVLKTWLESLRSEYDFILIDCMPSLGLIPINAFNAADGVLIPVSAEYLPSVAMTDLLKTIKRVQRQLNPKLAIEGAVITMFDRRTRISTDVDKSIRSGYGQHMRIFDTVIPRGVKASEAPASGQSMLSYAPKSRVAIAYRQLCKEVIAHG